MNNVRNSNRNLASSHHSVVSTKSSVLSLASTQRKLNRNDFAKCYADICHLQHINPLPIIKQHLDRGVLDFTADRVKFDEWSAIVSALRSDHTLHRIAIRLRQRIVTPILTADTDIKARNITNQPVIATKFVLYWLLEALKNCVSQSPTLTVLELEGLPLQPEFLALLAQGIPDTKSLQHLSFSKCGITDEGAEVITIAVRNAPTIISLNLSNCDLTHIGAMSVAKLISLQKLNRFSETWKQTLRYRDPDIEAMPGLRRLSLNHNPEIGDKGVEALVHEARDDLWLRAVDLQNTGLTDEGASHLVHLVRNNPNLSVVDARHNPGMSDDCLSEIMAILAINNADKSGTEYKWLSSQGGGDNGGECKKSTSRSSIPRSWTSIPKLRKQSTFTAESSPKPGKQFTPERRRQEDSLMKENQFLRRQVEELNRILDSEIKMKAEILQKNYCLMDALEHCQAEKKEMEMEFSQKSYVSEEALTKINHILRQLTNEDGFFDEVPDMLGTMKAVFDPGHSKKRVNLKHQVIMEEDELSTEELSSKAEEEAEEMNATKRAQEVFQKILKQKSK